jgi:hypothetical protein
MTSTECNREERRCQVSYVTIRICKTSAHQCISLITVTVNLDNAKYVLSCFVSDRLRVLLDRKKHFMFQIVHSTYCVIGRKMHSWISLFDFDPIYEACYRLGYGYQFDPKDQKKQTEDKCED